MTYKSGFTLIELLVVIAIVAILAAIAIPLYQAYVARTQVLEALMLMDSTRQLVVESYNSGVLFSDMNSGVGVFPAATAVSGQYVTKVVVVSGVVSAEFGNNAHVVLKGHQLVMTPEVNTGAWQWRCSYTDASGFFYMPAVCRSSP